MAQAGKQRQPQRYLGLVLVFLVKPQGDFLLPCRQVLGEGCSKLELSKHGVFENASLTITTYFFHTWPGQAGFPPLCSYNQLNYFCQHQGKTNQQLNPRISLSTMAKGLAQVMLNLVAWQNDKPLKARAYLLTALTTTDISACRASRHLTFGCPQMPTAFLCHVSTG